MARQETVLNVFVSSPSDLVEDRDTVEEIVDEVNRTLSANVGVRLVALRWETSVTPGIGPDAQSVINTAIGENYDVFVGIMGSRFGEPTPRYGSGTEEEFTIAYKRHLQNQNDLRVLFYFKDTPLHPSKINPDQLAAVQSFKLNLSSKGVLYSSYTSRDEFQKLLRLHLSEIVQTWRGRNNNSISPSLTEAVKSPATDIEEDDVPTILDLLADSEEGFDSINGIIIRMSAALNELTAKINGRSAEIDSLTQQKANPDFRAVKRACSGAARDMDEFRARLEPELVLFSTTHTHVMDCTTKVMSMARDANAWNSGEAHDLIATISNYIEILIQTIGSMTGFRDSVANVPRATIEFNKSRNRTVKLIDRLIETLVSAKNLTQETQRVIIEINSHHS